MYLIIPCNNESHHHEPHTCSWLKIQQKNSSIFRPQGIQLQYPAIGVSRESTSRVSEVSRSRRLSCLNISSRLASWRWGPPWPRKKIRSQWSRKWGSAYGPRWERSILITRNCTMPSSSGKSNPKWQSMAIYITRLVVRGQIREIKRDRPMVTSFSICMTRIRRHLSL